MHGRAGAQAHTQITHAPTQTPFGDVRDGALPNISDKDRARIDKIRAKEDAAARSAFEVCFLIAPLSHCCSHVPCTQSHCYTCYTLLLCS